MPFNVSTRKYQLRVTALCIKNKKNQVVRDPNNKVIKYLGGMQEFNPSLRSRKWVFLQSLLLGVSSDGSRIDLIPYSCHKPSEMRMFFSEVPVVLLPIQDDLEKACIYTVYDDHLIAIIGQKTIEGYVQIELGTIPESTTLDAVRNQRVSEEQVHRILKGFETPQSETVEKPHRGRPPRLRVLEGGLNRTPARTHAVG